MSALSVCEVAKPDGLERYWQFVRDLCPASEGQFLALRGYLVGIATFGPAAARRVLEVHNRDNRPRSRNMIRKLERNMRDGAFLLNGDTVVFDDRLNLRNGQTRMMACVAADTPFETFCVIGLPSGGYITNDQHGRRSTAHEFARRKEPHPTTLSAAVHFMQGFFLHGTLTHAADSDCLTIWDDEAMLQDHPDLRESAKAVHALKLVGKAAQKAGGTGLVTAAHYLFSRVDPGRADALFQSLSNLTVPIGEEYDPVRRLLQILMQNVANGSPMTRYAVGALTVKAWNAFLNGRGARSVFFKDGEPYPTVSGWDYDDRFLPVAPAARGEG